MGNLGFTEIMIILLVVLLVFGAKRLPEVGASIGKGIREFKRSLSDTQDEVMRQDNHQSLPRVTWTPRRVHRRPPASRSDSRSRPGRESRKGDRFRSPFCVSTAEDQDAACCCAWARW